MLGGVQKNKMPKIVLIYPKLGSGDVFIKDLPLSLIYASVDSVKNGFDVKIIDLRFAGKAWREIIDKELTTNTILAGLSVMTGTPIKYALEVSQYIKNKKPSIPIVWGGPHPTVEPDTTIKNEYIDFLIRGYGSESLYKLTRVLSDKIGNFEDIKGLSYKKYGEIYHNPLLQKHEMPSYKDIPYHLIKIKWDKFDRFDSKNRVFPIFTSFGCKYNCAFCISPTLYSKMEKRWTPYPVGEIIGHIEMAVEKYGANYISVTDDDSFIDLDRMYTLFQEIKKRKLNITIGFRGARVNELDRMNSDYFRLMEEVGVREFAIGVESGSDRALKLMCKGIKVEQVIRVNKKLAQFPKLRPFYNIMTGIPGETLKDLKMTRDLMLKLVKENPYCLIGSASDFKPIPGSKLFNVAIEYGLKPPKTLEGWSKYDSFDACISHPWYKKSIGEYIHMMQVTSYFIDDKILKEMTSNKFIYKIVRTIARLYKPLALFRLKNNIKGFLIEYKLMKYVLRFLSFK